MTSTWKATYNLNTPFVSQAKFSPGSSLLTDVSSNGRNSVVSDPGYSSAANSVSTDYQDFDGSFMEGGTSPRHCTFNRQAEPSYAFTNPGMQTLKPEIDFSYPNTIGQQSVHTSSKMSTFHINEQNFMQQLSGVNSSKRSYKNYNIYANSGNNLMKFLSSGQSANGHSTLRRNRSTSELEDQRSINFVQSPMNHSSPPSVLSYALDEQKTQIDIPAISVDEYLFTNENAFTDPSSGNTTLSSMSNKTGNNNSYYTNTSIARSHPNETNSNLLPNSRLPSTESFYDGSVSNMSPVSPVQQYSPLSQISPVPSDGGNWDTTAKTSFNSNSSYNNNTMQAQAGREFTKMTTPLKQQYPQVGDEDWKAYLENPLAAAATLSTGSDDGSNSDIGSLYEYYKVPQEKRLQTCQLLNSADTEFERNQTTIGEQSSPIITYGIQSSIVTSSNHDREQTSSKMTLLQTQRQPPNKQNRSNNFSNLIKPDFYANDQSSSNVSTYNTVSSALIQSKTRESTKQSYFQYIMEAPKSLKQKESDPVMSYINKGQFYCITLQRTKQDPTKSTKVRSVVQVVFGDSKPEDEQQRHWRYWHARQHTAKQRILDIADYKESNMIYDIEEISHNAIAFSWDCNNVAKIYISCNCLSTDFSAQKGIKGLPLLLQIDTYNNVDGNNNNKNPNFDRAVCQIKVFCDKGAERKIRDEERKALRKSQKKQGASASRLSASNYLSLAGASPTTSKSYNQNTNAPNPTNAVKKMDEVYFKNITDLTPPVYFIPDVFGHGVATHIPSVNTSPKKSSPSSVDASDQYYYSSQVENGNRKRSHTSTDADEDGVLNIAKIARTDRKVLLYVRSESEEIYNGLMLRTPDLIGLKSAIEEKYSYPAKDIRKLLKRSKKGITVNMDDNIIKHYSNEDTFIIMVHTESSASGVVSYCITLTEV